METAGRFLQPHTGSFFLFGPRGTGKSTWLRSMRDKAIWIDMLDPETLRLFQARPERLQERIAAQPQITDVVIDEVQKVPALLDVVHKLVDPDRIQCQKVAPRRGQFIGRKTDRIAHAPVHGCGTWQCLSIATCT